MKINNLIYALSLIVLIVAIFLAIENPDSNRVQLIAGGTVGIGILLNIFSFFTRKANQKS